LDALDNLDDLEKGHLGQLTSVYNLETLLFNEKLTKVYEKYEEDPKKVKIDINIVKNDLETIFLFAKKSNLLDPEINYNSWITYVGEFFTSVQNIRNSKVVDKNDIEKFNNANSKIINILKKIYDDLVKYIKNQDFKFKNETLFRTTEFLGRFFKNYQEHTTAFLKDYKKHKTVFKLEHILIFAQNMDHEWKYLNMITINKIYKNLEYYERLDDPKYFPFFPVFDDTILIFLKILLHIHSGRIKTSGVETVETVKATVEAGKEERGAGEEAAEAVETVEKRLQKIEARLQKLEDMLNKNMIR